MVSLEIATCLRAARRKGSQRTAPPRSIGLGGTILLPTPPGPYQRGLSTVPVRRANARAGSDMTRKRSIMALACSGTNKVMKCPAPTAWPASHRRLDPSPDSRAGRGPIHWSHGHLRRIRTVGLCRVGHCGVIRSDGRPWVGGLPRSSHVGFGEVTANAAEALLAAFAATLIARKFLAPNFALIAAAILPLVPGLSLFTGLLQAVESGTEPGDLAAAVSRCFRPSVLRWGLLAARRSART